EGALLGHLVGQADHLLDHGPAGELREPAVHRVSRVEEKRLSPVAAEDQEDLEEELVAPVAEDQPVGLGPPPSREDLAEIVATTGISVEKDPVQLFSGDVPAGHVRFWPLVRVN